MSAYLNMIIKSDFTAAEKEHHRLTPLFKNCFVESNPIPVKAGMASLGLIENELRPPLYASTKKTYDIISNTVKELNIK
jgi:4-hydroxy-tetrahydrodipicolinate synthase